MGNRKIDDSEYQFDKKQLGRTKSATRVTKAAAVLVTLLVAALLALLLTGCASEPEVVEVTREVPVTQIVRVTHPVQVTREVEVVRTRVVHVTRVVTATHEGPTSTPLPTYTPRPTKTPKPTDPGPLFKSRGDGTYYVGSTIGTGLWESTARRENCYWETFDANGNIINNFYGNSGGGQKVHLTDYVYGVEFNGCGSWFYRG